VPVVTSSTGEDCEDDWRIRLPSYRSGRSSAVSLGIADAVKEMPDLQTLIPDGVAWLDRWAVRQGVPDFLSLDEIGKQHALEAALGSDDDVASQFIWLIRFRAGLIYYSEPAIKAAFRYTGPPQPNGFGDFAGPPQ
jgi:hypothetical protein